MDGPFFDLWEARTTTARRGLWGGENSTDTDLGFATWSSQTRNPQDERPKKSNSEQRFLNNGSKTKFSFIFGNWNLQKE
jgi:hypothetical protein